MPEDIYCFHGLGADARVFSRLDFGKKYRLIPVSYIDYRPYHTLRSFAEKMAEQIPAGSILLGDSFGGMVAQEVARVNDASQLILLSTVKKKREIGIHLRVSKHIKGYRAVSSWMNPFLVWWVNNMHWGIEQDVRELFTSMLSDFDPQFAKWIIRVVCEWSPPELNNPVIHVHGTKDIIFPHVLIQDCTSIKGGGHSMVLERASCINEVVLKQLI